MTLPATALARPVDLRLPSNRLAVLAAVLAAVIVTVVIVVADAETGLATAAGRGGRAGIGTFLAWAVARELDPDRAMAARNAVLAAFAALVLGLPSLAAVLAVLLSARVLVRSTGVAPTWPDVVVAAAVAAFAATSAPGFVAGLALAWAVFDDSRLPDPATALRAQLGSLAVAVAAVATSVGTGSFVTLWRVPTTLELVWVALVVGAVAVRRRPVVVASGDDRDGPLVVERVRRARTVVGGTLALALVWAGASAVPALAPAAAALIGIGAAAPRWVPNDPSPSLDVPPGAIR